jgi:hypothetical protein
MRCRRSGVRVSAILHAYFCVLKKEKLMTTRIARVALIAALTSLVSYAWSTYRRHSAQETHKFDKAAVQEWETDGGSANANVH